MAIADSIRESMERGSWIRQMFEAGAQLKAKFGAENVFDFSLGNPILEPPEEVHQQLLKLLENPEKGMHRYMPNAGFPETREFVAEIMQTETKLPFQSGDVVMCVGAGGGLNVVLKTLLNPGDEVLALAPYFVEYGSYVNNHGGNLSVVNTTADFQPDLAAIEDKLNPRTKAVIINSPNNPTGAVYPQEILDQLGELLKRKSLEFGHVIYLISDDIYRYLVFDGLTNSNAFLSYSNSILVNSHSKDLGLPGERIGYIAVHPEIAEREELQQALVLCNRILGFVNAPAMMQKILPLIGNARVDISVYEKSRNRIFSMITELGFEAIKPQGAFYIFPKSPEEDDVAFVKRAQEENILLVPGTGFGGPGHFRISLCCSTETIDNSRAGFKRLADYYGL
ncbi:MAG: pyridoxal phosphate-dependent aminotransferase [SAR324 cluster bacterium]|nr:pyridoxal phosphate-dependent aminotransferase [SAR324 cluster bacterium]MBL7034765.1 pyridoxal phosphate-dependent aminotransferase [SAR324 cluster bacterium]